MVFSRKILLGFLAATTLAAGGVVAGSNELTSEAENKNLSQLVRSTSPHYWTFMKSHLGELGLENYIGAEGFLSGDAHLGNFGIIPVMKKSGEESLDFVNIDFDDAGIGPFILDFIRFEITTEAIGIGIKKRAMEEAYVQGLSGKRRAPPAFVRELLDMSMTEYRQLAQRLVEKNTEGEQFSTDKKLTPYHGKISRADVQKIFPETKVLDIAVKPNERGGSAGTQRLWVLTENAKGRKQIFELKEYQETSIAKFQAQPDLQTWLNQLYKTFWLGLDRASYDLVKMTDGNHYWRREKKVALIDIPYSSGNANKHQMIQDLALYDAYYLGVLHARQPGAKAYLERIESDREDFHERTENVVKTYLKLAKTAL